MKTLISPPDRKVTKTRVTGIIEKSLNLYTIYIEEDLPGVGLFGYGDSEEEAKEDLLVAVEEYKELLQEEGKSIPRFLNNLEISYRYAPSSLQARMTGQSAVLNSHNADHTIPPQTLEKIKKYAGIK